MSHLPLVALFLLGRLHSVVHLGSAAAFLMYFQSSPFDSFLTNLQVFFTGTFAKALTLIAIVIAGVTYSHSRNGGSETVARVAIGAAIALMAANIMAWITT